MHNAIRFFPLPALAGIALLAQGGCGIARRSGDEGGEPVTFQVHLDHAFLTGMRNHLGQGEASAGAGFSSGGGRSFGTGIGLSPAITRVFLLGGDAMGEAGVFRQELRWGDSTFSVPLKAGRTVQLAIQAQGGPEGWEGVGSAIIPNSPNPVVTIAAGEAGGKATVTTAVASPPAK